MIAVPLLGESAPSVASNTTMTLGSPAPAASVTVAVKVPVASARTLLVAVLVLSFNAIVSVRPATADDIAEKFKLTDNACPSTLAVAVTVPAPVFPSDNNWIEASPALLVSAVVGLSVPKSGDVKVTKTFCGCEPSLSLMLTFTVPGDALLMDEVAIPSELRTSAIVKVGTLGVTGAASVVPVSAALPQAPNIHTPSSITSHAFNLTCQYVRIIVTLV